MADNISTVLEKYVSKENLIQYNQQTIVYIKKLIANKDASSDKILKTHINDSDIHMDDIKNIKLNESYKHAQAQHARVDATKTGFSRTINSGSKIGSLIINNIPIDLFSPEIVDDLTSTNKDKVLSANMGRELNSEISNLKKSVSDSKNKVASAITSMGIQTSSDATYDTIINNIKSIGANCTATTGDIISGKTAYVQGKTITGNMANRGNISKTITVGDTITLDPGYYGKITITAISS